MALISYVPLSELARIRALGVGAERRAALLATACRINTLYMVARAGSGHLGTSFSCLDILTWLFLEEMRPDGTGAYRDLYFSSKGHDAPALYSVLTSLGLLDFEMIHRLRRLGGLPGHPDIAIPFMVTNTGSLGMGISKAKGLILANRLAGRTDRVFVLTGDGELQEGQIWEALATAVHRRLGELTVIVDRNQIQSDTWVNEVSDLGDLPAKFRAFGWHVDQADGHDPAALKAAFARLRSIDDRPKVLLADTLKGRGVSFMQPDAMDPVQRMYRFHSGAPNDDVYEKALAELVQQANGMLRELGGPGLALETVERPTSQAPSDPQRLVAAYSRALIREGARRPDLVVLDADLVLDCGLVQFREKFPERFVECGIAEQDMVSQAVGLALRGLLPIVHSFAAFLSARPNEQIYNNATEGTKIIYVGSLAGLLPAGPGHTHQCVRDIAALGAIPGLIMLEPSTEREVELAVDFCVNHAPTSCYLRLVSIPAEIPYLQPALDQLEIGRGFTVRPGRDGVIIGYGPIMLSQAYRAAELVAARAGIDLSVVNLPWLNRVDPDWLRALVTGQRWLFTLDNHYLHGGQGELILCRLAELALPSPPRCRRLGLDRVPLGGGNTEVLRAHHLDAESLAEEIARCLKDRLE